MAMSLIGLTFECVYKMSVRAAKRVCKGVVWPHPPLPTQHPQSRPQATREARGREVRTMLVALVMSSLA
jgi:hypothetical protein